ncbi:hypothetical protein CXQ85_001226 [Candidozyma haemuli]|uniref:LSM complex subunit LSM4 n=1 Tax=Candidozyma haemuli TaxID=45357 RepID=A0A2V1AML8_9ASCO|nr:hypothetical protein CXQ85_001226 [[Candida] haemuloni]PVH18934.1 hypothetical protein CXQ85_001226 [[Candida] haemuloni]
MLTSVKNQEILVELKNGETVYGKLTDCDSWMNLTLSEVVVNYNKGEKFNKLNNIYIRGSHIKFLRLPDSVMDHAKEQTLLSQEQRNRNQKRKGGFQNRKFNDNNRDREGRGGYGGRGGHGGRRNFNHNHNNNQHQTQGTSA